MLLDIAENYQSATVQQVESFSWTTYWTLQTVDCCRYSWHYKTDSWHYYSFVPNRNLQNSSKNVNLDTSTYPIQINIYNTNIFVLSLIRVLNKIPDVNMFRLQHMFELRSHWCIGSKFYRQLCCYDVRGFNPSSSIFFFNIICDWIKSLKINKISFWRILIKLWCR